MGINYNPGIVKDGLVLYLDAANKKSYSGSGVTWYDLSGQANHGTISGTTHVNNTFLFDTSSDTISVAHHSSLNFSDVFTVSAWILVNSFNTSSIYNVISKKPSFNNTQQGWSCQYDYRTTGILQYRNNNGLNLNDSTPTASINNTSLLNQTTTYCNVVWRLNGTGADSARFYINGIYAGNGTVSYGSTDTSSIVYIGKTVGSIGDTALQMNLGMISIYNRLLSTEEITRNYAALRGRYGV